MNDDAIAALHASPWYGSFVFAGGGANLLARLLAIPGASGTVADARIPYASEALAQYLGGAPDQSVAVSTARAMAMAALRQTLNLGVPKRKKPFGLAITASLRSGSPKRGDHRIHIGLQTLGETRTLSLTLRKDARSRAEEDAVVTALAWRVLAELARLSPEDIALLPGETPQLTRHKGNASWRRLLTGEANAVEYFSDAAPPSQAAPRLLFPGSFNPLHNGHLHMAAVAEAHTGMPVEFELCIANVDKAPLDYAEIRTRAQALPGDRALWLTRTGTFLAKARVFPGATFMLGIDTLLRIAEPRFYPSAAHRDAAVSELTLLGARFIVFGRRMNDGFLDLRQAQLPAALTALCHAVDERTFRADLSSSQLRAELQAGTRRE